MSKELFEVVDRLVHDQAFRTEFLTSPGKYLSEMGVSPDKVEKLAPAVMSAFVAGGIALNELQPVVDGMGWR